MRPQHRQAHAILVFLERGPATVTDIRAHVGAGMTPKRRIKLIYCIQAIEKNRLIRFWNGLCHITPAGRDWLEDRAPSEANIRLFTKEPANG